jgi:uncharacterized membrane protein
MVDIGKNLSQSFELYKNNIGTLIVAALITAILSSCIIITGPIMIGFLALCKKVKDGEQVELGELFAHFDKFAPSLILTLITLIPVVIIAVIPIVNFLMIVIGPAAFMIYTFGLLSIMKDDLAPVDAFKKGLELLQTNSVGNWVYALVMTFVSGICAFILMPVGYMGMIMAYEELTGGTTQTASDNVTPTV